MLANKQIFLICHLHWVSDNMFKFSFYFLLRLTGEGKNRIGKFGHLKIVYSWPFILINFQVKK